MTNHAVTTQVLARLETLMDSIVSTSEGLTSPTADRSVQAAALRGLGRDGLAALAELQWPELPIDLQDRIDHATNRLDWLLTAAMLLADSVETIAPDFDALSKVLYEIGHDGHRTVWEVKGLLNGPRKERRVRHAGLAQAV